MSITGPNADQPTKVGSSISDISSGLFATIGILSALYARDATDERGQSIDVSMLDSTVALLENAIVRYVASEEPPVPMGNRHPSIVPFESFETADGEIVVATGNDELWQRLCAALDLEELVDDPRFATNKSRNKHYDEFRPLLAETFTRHRADDWMELLDAAGHSQSPDQRHCRCSFRRAASGP